MPKRYRELWIGPSPDTARPAELVATAMQGGRPLVTTSLAADRTASEGLTGQNVYVDSACVPRDEVPVWGDLPGSKVVDAAGVELGVVEDVYNSGASDVVIVRRADGKALDLALAPQYVDVEAGIREGTITLLVYADVFAELWQ